ncbi:uncharacterized protein LOC142775529, partial [Rhipicephalus microplus]|uniref:uncharacterized protein LOC142775529 n=1 Tax=Rhipicephalus microplus TaxID=6941 RepID=UPI003F6C26AA
IRIFENFLLASGVSNCAPDRRKALLIHSLGVEGQRIFYTLPLQSSANAKSGEPTSDTNSGNVKYTSQTQHEASSYDTAVTALHAHFTTTTNVVVERHRFGRRVQQVGETINEYITALRELSATCSFSSQEDSLRDQFVAGVLSQNLRERLLLEGSSLSFAKAVLIATQFEQATNDCKEFATADVKSINARENTPPPASSASDPSKRSRSQQGQCYRCGSPRHNASSFRCPAKNKRCHGCGIMGHFRSVCNRNAALVREVDDESSITEVLSILAKTTFSCLAIYVSVAVGKTYLTFLVNLGSSVSILTHDLFRQHFAGRQLSAARIRLLNYSKKPIPVCGCFFADVMYNNCTTKLLFYVVEQGTSLLGIDAIRALSLQIDGSSLQCLETTAVRTSARTEHTAVMTEAEESIHLPSELVEEFGAFFNPGLGIAKGFVHRVKTLSTVQPVASKLRRLPLSLRPRVSEELRRLEKMDVIERIEASEWVSQIVVVETKDGGIRLCVDLRQVNKAVVTDSFPLLHT